MAQSGAKQIETALLTEHLRFTPLTLLDDIINTVNLLMNRAVDAAEQGLLDAPLAALGYTLPLSTSSASESTTAIQETQEDLETRARREIEEGVVKLETLLESNVDRNFDKFEIYVLRNILCVPGDLVPWVKLGHYEGLDFSKARAQRESTTSTEQGGPVRAPPTQESVQTLRRRLREARRLHGAMSAQIAENSKLIAQLRALTAPAGEPAMDVHGNADGAHTRDGALAFLRTDASAQKLGIGSFAQQQSAATKGEPIDGDAMDTATTAPTPAPGPLETNTSFAISQLPALRALVAELRSKSSASLKTAASSSDKPTVIPHRRDKDYERRLYIESQSRKAVERMQGLAALSDASAGAASRDLLVGRRVGADEVVALEGIAKGLQRSREEGGEEMDES